MALFRTPAAPQKLAGAAGGLPPSLHPVVDDNACICSGACITACPEGEILQIVDGVARLVEASRCIGHGECAKACPVDAIRLVFGSSERGIDLPALSLGFESSRKGVHIVGELGGMGLIKNAVRQGLELGIFFEGRMTPGDAADGVVDVAICGAGPAGLATALACRLAGFSFRLFDQGTLGGTVAHYPRQKVVMTEVMELPFYGRFGARTIEKEQLLAIWQQACAKADVRVQEQTQLTDIRGSDGAFDVDTSRGVIRARKVVLACGRRGTPRTLDVRGEDASHVAYTLIDAEQYDNTHVLVVGGGDAALESAIMLAQRSTAVVTLSYRGDNISRARPANVAAFEALVQEGRVQALLESHVTAITPDEVHLRTKKGHRSLRSDYVLVHIGGTLPDALLGKLKLSSRRHTGVESMPVPGYSEDERRRSTALLYAGLAQFSLVAFCLVSVMFLAVLGVSGFSYYGAPLAERVLHAQHVALRPAGSIGRTLGVVATFVMALNFVYGVRKRVAKLQGFGELRDWLNLHMLVGLLTPVFVAFHAAFQSNNLVATGSSIALLGVSLTGLIGRFVYALAPTANEKILDLPDLMTQWERLRYKTHKDLQDVALDSVFRRIDSIYATLLPRSRSVLLSLARLLKSYLLLSVDLVRARRYFANYRAWGAFALHLTHVLFLRAQIAAYEPFLRLLEAWRVLHIGLSFGLVALIVLHIGIVMYVGYGWAVS